MRRNIYEIFTEFQTQPTRQGKIQVLRDNMTTEMQCVLRGAFHPQIKYLVDEIPPYKTSDALPGLGWTSIGHEMDRVYLFEAGNPKRPANLKERRMYDILIQMLESMEAREAKVFAGMLTKNLNIPGLDYAIVKEAVPNLLP